MNRRHIAALLTLSAVAVAWAAKPRVPKPALPAAQYPFHDTHPAEHVTVAAEPGDTDETAPNTRLDYFHHGLLPVRVIVTNDSDQSLSLDEARMHFITADGDSIPAATDEDLQRRLFSAKSAAGTKIPLPNPLPNITIHHAPVDKTILQDDTDFGFHNTLIPPHTTAAGYLYYDVRGVDDPILAHATFEVRKIQYAPSGKELFSFEIPLKPAPITPTKDAPVATKK